MDRHDRQIHYGDDGIADSLKFYSADRGLHVSNDGKRVVSGLLNVRPQKRARRTAEDLPDVYADWTPVPDNDLGEVGGVADTVTSYDVSPDDDTDTAKRKRYASSDEPMSLWRPLAGRFLDGLMRREGLGDYTYDPACALCKTPHSPTRRLFRCDQCGEFLAMSRLRDVKTRTVSVAFFEGMEWFLTGSRRTSPAAERRRWGWCTRLGTMGSLAAGRARRRGYKEHLKGYVAEKDVSTCIASPPCLQKETPSDVGPADVGVGGLCMRARNGVVPSAGLGDLQKGERYANMEYIYYGDAVGCRTDGTHHLVRHRMPVEGQPPMRATKIKDTTDLPTNLDDFRDSIRHYRFGMREMGYGARQDAIENNVDHLNFEKNVGQGDTLARKIIVAIAERDRQVAEFTEIDRTLSKEFRKKWQKKIDKWLADKSQPNPYCLAGGKNGGPSEAAVFLELKTAEAQEAAEGREAVSASTATPTAFVKAGMQLEESQRRIKAN
ncbi:hypothetical protein DFH06DRAFT_1351152 [Mycena polygramma]|nr:hypothetical protein DFH06DRAFT_1351152 [Mycena polygramma]